MAHAPQSARPRRPGSAPAPAAAPSAAAAFCQTCVTLCCHAQEIRVRCGTPETGVAGPASRHHAAAGVAMRPAAQHARPLHRAGRSLAAAAARRLPGPHRGGHSGPARDGRVALRGPPQPDHRVGRGAPPSAEPARAEPGRRADPVDRSAAERRVRAGAPDQADAGPQVPHRHDSLHQGPARGRGQRAQPDPLRRRASRRVRRGPAPGLYRGRADRGTCGRAGGGRPRCSAMRWPKSATASGRWPRPTAGS